MNENDDYTILGKFKKQFPGRGTTLKEDFMTFIHIHIMGISVFILILFILLIYLFYQQDPLQWIEKYPSRVILGWLIIGYIIFMSIFFVNWNIQKKKKEKKKYGHFLLLIISSILGIGGMASLFILVMKILELNSSISSIILILVNISIVIVLLSIIFKILGKSKKWEHVLPFGLENFKSVIFYIPCLFISLVENIKTQFNITPKPIWILLFIEILLITLRYLLPLILNKLVIHDGKELLIEKTYLNRQNVIGTYEHLHKNKNKNKQETYSYKYAISAWLYINPQSVSTSEAYTQNTSLLNYGDKPNIMYNGEKNLLIVKAKKNRDDIIEVYKTNKLLYQRWNHLVINYDRGTLDVFVNNELVSSMKNIVPYMTHDQITVGSYPGINGGVTDVIYYDDSLSRNKINDLYKFNKLHK